jgi:hypothetical protein
MGGMAVESDFDCSFGGVGGVEELEKLDEFPTSLSLLGQRMDLTGNRKEVTATEPRGSRRR